MRIYNQYGTFDLGKEFSSDFEIYNPCFSDQGEQSMPLTLPPTDNNYKLLNWATRLDRKNSIVQDQDVFIQVGPSVIKGRLVIAEPDDDDNISATIYYGNGMFYSDLTYPDGTEKMMTDLLWPTLNLGSASAAVDYLYRCFLNGGDGFDGYVFPVAMRYGLSDWNERNSTLGDGVTGTKEYGTKIFFDCALNYPAGLNASANTFYLQARNDQFQIKTDSDTWTKHPIGFGATLFLKLGYVIDFIFTSFGYTFTDNPFKSDNVLKLQCLLNNTSDASVTGKLEYKNLIPDVEISTFIKFVEEKFGLKFILKNKNVSVRYRNTNAPAAEAPDMDLTLLKSERAKVSWADFKQLKLSASRSIEYASTEVDTMELFKKKYTGIILSANSPTDLRSTNYADGVYFCRSTNSFFTKKTVYADDGTSSKSIEFTGSNFYDHTSGNTALAYEEHASSDEHVPMVLMAFAQDGNTYALPIAVPFVGEPRNLYTTLYINKNAQSSDTSSSTEMKIMLASRTKQKQTVLLADGTTAYSYWGGTTNIYSNDGSSRCIDIDLRNNGYDPDGYSSYNLYSKFWAIHDQLLKTSLQKVKCNLHLDVLSLLNLKPETGKLLDNQRVLPYSLKYSIDTLDRIKVSECYWYTQRPYTSASAAYTYNIKWVGFVCEGINAGLATNKITAATFIRGGNLYASATSEKAIPSGTSLSVKVTVKYTISWVQDYYYTFNVTIASGATYGESTIWIGAVIDKSIVTSFSMTPTSDSTYSYIKDGQINTGYARSLTFSVEKIIDGVTDSVITFDGKQSFTYNSVSYALLTDAQLRALSFTDFQTRRSAFIAWFFANHASDYPQLTTIDASGSRIQNTTLCPI